MPPRRYRIDHPEPSETEFLRSELERRGWEPTDGEDWTLFWSNAMHHRSVFARLRPHQRINHYAGIGSLIFKDELHRYLAAAADRARSAGAEEWYRFVPRTFSMPDQRSEFTAQAAADPGKLWIVKPAAASMGEGVRVIVDPSDAPTEPGWIVQHYVANPLLLPGYPFKHVLRIYVALTSLEPLTAYVYENAVVKFTSRPYTPEPAHAADLVVHLTNPTVQRTNQDVADPVRARDLPEYRGMLQAAHIDDRMVWSRIRHMLVQTLLAHSDPITRRSRAWSRCPSCSFELLGFDVVVDAELQPWVLECNMSPMLGARAAAGTPAGDAQRRIKHGVVSDLMDLVDHSTGPGPGFASLIPGPEIAGYPETLVATVRGTPSAETP